MGPQRDQKHWPEMQQRFAAIFKTKTRDEWCEILGPTDACFAPVLSLSEAPYHPHNKARGVFIEIDGVIQPAPGPHFSRTKPSVPKSGPKPGTNTVDALVAWGFTKADVEVLVKEGAVGWQGANTKAAE